MLIEWGWHLLKNADAVVTGAVVGAVFMVFFLRIKANYTKVVKVADEVVEAADAAKKKIKKN